jgi:DNA-binding transcriptional LysR family regulator
VEMHQIHYFLKVARTLNMTRAAAELHLSQPSLSRQIKLLEEELSVLLFERLPQGLRMTPAGLALQAHLDEVVQRLAQTAQLLQPFARGVRGRVTIGCVPSLAATFIPGALPAFLSAHPEVETAVQVIATSGEVFRQIHDGTIDIGLCPDEDPSLAQAFLFTDPLLAALPAESGKAEGEVLGLARLQELPYVATPAACTVLRRVEAATDGRLNRVLAVGQIDTALQFVAQGVGITVAPASLAAHKEWPGVRFLPLDPPLSQSVYAFWRPGSFVDPSHPLLQFLRAHGRELPSA